MKHKNIRDYLDINNDVVKLLVQAKVDSVIVRECRKIMGSQLTWNALIEACLKKFIDEMKE